MESAACAGADSSLFVLQERNGGARDQTFWAENEARFKLALEFCATCAVIQQCGDSASRSDYKYTVRGGRSPHSEVKPVTEADRLVAEKAWETYCRGGDILNLGGASWVRFKALREAHIASTPEVSWRRYQHKGRSTIQRPGNGWPLGLNEEAGTYTILMKRGVRYMRHAIEADRVVWAEPVGE